MTTETLKQFHEKPTHSLRVQIIAAGLFFEIAALILTGGASFIAKVLSLIVSGVGLGLAIAEAVENCDGVDRLSCSIIAGYDFFETFNSFENSLPFQFDSDTNAENAIRCTDGYQSLCKGFNTDGFLKFKIQPFDEWISYPDNGDCRGLFVKEGTDICRRDIDGYVYYDDYESPGNVVAQVTSGTLLDVAAECDSRGGSCQGFNTAGDVKSTIGSVDTWCKSTPVGFSPICLHCFCFDLGSRNGAGHHLWWYFRQKRRRCLPRSGWLQVL